MQVRRFVACVAVPLSATASVTLPAATAAAAPTPVTVRVIGAQTYGGQPAFAGATGIAGVTVSGVTCTGLADGTAISPTLGALGSYTIAGGSCSGGTLSSPDYEIAGYVGSSHTVYRAPLTVSADPQTRTFGDANPTLTHTVTGFVNGEDPSVLTGAPALATSATPSSDVGDYPITVAKGTLAVPGGNYHLKLVPGSLAVRPRPLTVTVTGAQEYGVDALFFPSSGVAGVTVPGVRCTRLTDGQEIAPGVAVGAYTIESASCTGGTPSNGNYEIGSYRGGRFSVLRAALAVTATDASREYGRANPSLGYTVSGFRNGDDAASVTGAPEVSTIARSSSDVGDYPITPTVGTLSSANYRFVFVPGTLTVRPRQVTVAVTGAQTYGEDPVFAGTASVAGVAVSELTCSGLAGGQPIARTLPVGNGYAIDPATCSGRLSSPNHAIASYRSAGFAVYKAPLTVAATDVTRIYGFANPTLRHTVTGFKNGEDTTALGGAPDLTTPAVVKSDAGSYPIDVAIGSLTAANYRFVLQPGTLTVTKRALVVRADPASRAYGDAAPAYTATFTGFRNGDTAASLAGAPGFTTTATSESPPGSYPLQVSAGTLASPNYTFTGFSGSTLTVTTAVPTMSTTPVGGGRVAATVTYGAASTPVVGSTITFLVGRTSTVACRAETDATGTATCRPSALNNTQILLAGYTARFPGATYLEPVERHQGLSG